MSLIECKGVSLGYDGKTVVSDLSFNVENGEYLCIVGENGCGKSTLMKAVLGLKKPVQGEIKFGEGLLKNEIGYLPQQTNVQQDFPASVQEIVISGCLSRRGINPFYSAKEKALAHNSMERLGLLTIKKSCYRELSGGQQQRVLLARALCATKKLLFLDEPVAGLDPIVTLDLYKLIEKLNKVDGITVIMISHDIRAAVDYSSHILHLGEKPYFFGRVEDYSKSGMCRRFIGDQAD